MKCIRESFDASAIAYPICPFIGIGNPSLNNKNLRSQIEKYFNERSEIGVNNINELYKYYE